MGGPGRFECAECTGVRVPLKSGLLFKDVGNPSAFCLRASPKLVLRLGNTYERNEPGEYRHSGQEGQSGDPFGPLVLVSGYNRSRSATTSATLDRRPRVPTESFWTICH